MVGLIPLLVAFPFILGLVLLATGSNRIRRPLVGVGVIAVIAGSLALAMPGVPESVMKLPVSPEVISKGMLAIEAVITLYLLFVSVRTRRPLIALLALAQAGLLGVMELGGGHHVR